MTSHKHRYEVFYDMCLLLMFSFALYLAMVRPWESTRPGSSTMADVAKPDVRLCI